MRPLLLSTLIASLILAVTSTDDSVTAWVLQATQDNTTSTVLEGETNQTSNKVNLTSPILDSTVDCTTRDQSRGVCVFFYQCRTKTNDNGDSAAISTSRINNCVHYLEVCCNKNDVIKEENGTNQTSEENDLDSEETPVDNQNPRTIPASTSTTPEPVVTVSDVQTTSQQVKSGTSTSSIPQCGRSNPGANPLVVRDMDAGINEPYALFGDFPWMVAILKKNVYSTIWSQKDYLGGGTLIHPSVVMTDAHKLATRWSNYQPNEFKCRAGEWDTQTESEIYSHEERDILKFIKHESYYRTSLYNDIALLILATPFQTKNTPHIGIGCLATSTPPPGSLCYGMGWGRDDPKDNKKFATILKKVPLQIIEHDTCQQMHRNNSRLGPLFILDESLMCAIGTEKVDTCKGDSGSPLVCTVSGDPAETRFAVHGLVSYGVTCFDPEIPRMYADTVHLKSWIDAKMQQESFDTAYYTL